MNVSLTPQLEAMIRQQVDSGRYNNASEVVREALRLLEEHERVQHLRSLLAVGLEQATAELVEFSLNGSEDSTEGVKNGSFGATNQILMSARRSAIQLTREADQWALAIAAIASARRPYDPVSKAAIRRCCRNRDVRTRPAASSG